MNHPILDTKEKDNLRQPIPWYRAGALGGLVSPVLVAILMYFQELVHLNAGTPYLLEGSYWLFVLPLPLLVAVVRVALWGSHQSHLGKVIGAALLGFFVMLTLMLASSSLLGFPHLPSGVNMSILPSATTLSVAVAFVAYLIWLAFGRIRKFREQVDPDF